MKAELEGMGFSSNRAVRALHHSGNSSIEGAINWLTEHEEDKDIDEPLLVPQVQGAGLLASCAALAGSGVWFAMCPLPFTFHTVRDMHAACIESLYSMGPGARP